MLVTVVSACNASFEHVNLDVAELMHCLGSLPNLQNLALSGLLIFLCASY
jgi:hypothetical protein